MPLGGSMTLRGLTLACAGVMLTAGCGKDHGGPGASCLKVQPCGGNVVGAWNIVATCATRAALDSAFAAEVAGSACPTQMLGNVEETPTGTLRFNSDLTYSSMFTINSVVDVIIPAACLGGTNCASVNANLQAELAAGLHPEVVSASCAGSSNCVCHQVISTPQSETGTYSIAGNAITLVEADGTTSGVEFCVQGDTVHLMNVTMSTIDTDVVGVRQ